jgi:hypothetical protein
MIQPQAVATPPGLSSLSVMLRFVEKARLPPSRNEVVLSESEPTDAQGDIDGPSAPDQEVVAAQSWPKRNVKLIAVAGGGALLLASIGALVVSLAQPSAVQRAADACSGSQPLTAFLEQIASSDSPAPEEAATETATDEDQFADLFSGVVRAEDGGKTLIVNTKPKDDDPLGLTSLALDCIYGELAVPAHISERIGVTRALDGRQDGSWGEFTASWSYHPDSGANIIIAQD